MFPKPKTAYSLLLLCYDIVGQLSGLAKAVKLEVTFCFVAKVAQLEEKLFVAIKENESLEETLTTAQGKVSIQVVVIYTTI